VAAASVGCGLPVCPVVGGEDGALARRPQAPLDRRHFNTYVWKAALIAAEVEPSRANGMHALRHFYASGLLDAGESIKAVGSGLHPADLHPSPAKERAADASGRRPGADWRRWTVDGLTTA
jgi:hypothetical protein